MRNRPLFLCGGVVRTYSEDDRVDNDYHRYWNDSSMFWSHIRYVGHYKDDNYSSCETSFVLYYYILCHRLKLEQTDA